MKLDKQRVLRTFIQAACGQGIALMTAIASDFRKETIYTSLIGFATTVVIAVLMNIQQQAEEKENDI